MIMVDCIEKKKKGEALTTEEINGLVEGIVSGTIPDYQLSALLMAIYFKGMTTEETIALTLAMAKSGDMADLSGIEGFKVDKHSTGGVGDKTSLIIAPIVASLGVKVAKMSGRGLGHTGGTVDKLESIPGFQTDLPVERFMDVVNKTGIAIVGQSGNFAPADKRLYALRDVTATVDSIPLIAASIMSKKLAAGSDGIVLDVKTGSGSFMRTLPESLSLARTMVSIGEGAGRSTVALITEMDLPLGHYIGNNLEIKEVIGVLKGQVQGDLLEVSLALATEMLVLAGLGDREHCMTLAKGQIANQKAFQKFCDMVEAQGGDVHYLHHPEDFMEAPYTFQVFSPESGYITHMDTAAIGKVATHLGAGRLVKEDVLDFTAGIHLYQKTGDKVEKGELLAVLYTGDSLKAKEAAVLFCDALTFGEEKPETQNLVLGRVEE